MKYDKDALRYNIKEIIEDYPNDGNVRAALRKLAEDLQITLEPREFKATGKLSPGGDIFYTDRGISLEGCKLYNKMSETFGPGWGGKEVTITVKEVL